MSPHSSAMARTGCGCSATAVTSSPGPGMCACGGSTCEPPAAFLRPRFFPGQLLTEDDLGKLVEYVAAKNRLHNRFLFGDGVVCGLEVACHPCGGGKVIVRPGYALDCCGDDIVVPCATELDVNQMVRDLLRARLGVDCGDPCKKAAEAGQNGEEADETGAAERAATSGSRPAATKPETAERRYCLYVRYCEKPAEPVAPYTTDDPCAAQACQFSRIQEGYSFELRCVEEEPDRPDFFQSMSECLAAVIRTPAPFVVLSTLRDRGSALEAAIAAAPEPDKAVFDEKDALRARELLGKAPGAELEERVLQLEESAKLVVKSDMAGSQSDAIEQLRKKTSELADEVIQAARMSKLPEIARVTAEEVALTCKHWIVRANQPTGWLLYEPRLLAGGFALSARLHGTYRQAIAELKPRLLGAVAGQRADCRLPSAIAAIQSPPVASTPFTKGDVQALSLAMGSLARGIWRYVKDCACLALLPRCAPCDDPAVPLACLTVAECEVIEVCNMTRRFVLAPTALRYWGAPLFDAVGDLLELFCCGDEAALGGKVSRVRRKAEERLSDLVLMSALARPELLRAAGLVQKKAARPEMASLGAGLVQGLAGVMGLPAAMFRASGVNVVGDLLGSWRAGPEPVAPAAEERPEAEATRVPPAPAPAKKGKGRGDRP